MKREIVDVMVLYGVMFMLFTSLICQQASAMITIFNDALIPNITVNFFDPATYDNSLWRKAIFWRTDLCETWPKLHQRFGEFGIPSDNLDVSMIINDGSHILLQDNVVEGLKHHHRFKMVAYLTNESNKAIHTLFKLWNRWNLLVNIY